MKVLDNLYLKAICKMKSWKEKILYNEDGDTNFISIIIVLGIVLALVVVFRGYITDIIGKIGESVSSFSNDPF